MIRVMLAAPRSGGGKTTVSCALLRALQKRGRKPCAFKCGPDYLDPAFHRAVLGVESHNLDLFLCSEERLRALFRQGCAGHGAAVCEGVMGYFDGLGGDSDRASSWHVAVTLGLPVVLVLPARGASLTLAAEIIGLRAFRADSRIVGVILNECAPRLCRTLAPALERETGVPVLGCLPQTEAARFESRYLGLCAPSEIERLGDRLDELATLLAENVDLERLERLCACPDEPETQEKPEYCGHEIRVAVANDKAFNFTYSETFETLRALGVEPIPFSPLRDETLPDKICALYLPGGYPERFTRELFYNSKMRESINRTVRNGLPTVAECGGFLYLGTSLCDKQGAAFPMAGVLPGAAADAGRPVRFGYQTLCAETDSLLFRAGERVPAHEFHYWESDSCGEGLLAEKGGRSWRCCFVNETLYAGFPHLYFAGRPELAERFAAAARHYGEENGII